MSELRDLVLINDTRDALALWVARKTGDEKLAAEIRLLTPSEMLVRFHRAAVRRRKRVKVSELERQGKTLLRDLKAHARGKR